MRRPREAELECEEASSKMKNVKHNPNQKQMKVTTTPASSRDSSRRNDHPRKIESCGKSRPSEKRRKLKVTVQDQE
jgi:hypothetical protein